MKNKPESLELVKDRIAQDAIEQTAAAQGEVRREEALMFLGGIGAVNKLAEKLSSQAIRALEAFGESKGHEALGYETFANFLNESPYAPMKKSAYYNHLNALTSEGDATYDLLNHIGVSLSKRKLLSEGAVMLDGDTLVVGEARVPINDRRRIVEAVKTLVETTQQQARKIEKGTEDNKKLKKKINEQKQAGNGAALSEYDSALITVLGALANLKSLAYELTDPQRLEKREYTFERIAEARLELEEALGVSAPSTNGDFDLAADEIDDLADTM
jgi:hypothetical protein